MGTAQGVHFVIMSACGEVFEDAKEVIIPVAAHDLDVARLALGGNRLGPRLFVARGRGKADVEAVQSAGRCLCLCHASGARVLHVADGSRVAILLCILPHRLLDRVRAGEHLAHVLNVVDALGVFREQQTNGCVRVVVAAFLCGGPVPVPHTLHDFFRRGVLHAKPLAAKEIASCRPHIPVAAKQSLAVNAGQGLEVGEVGRVLLKQNPVVVNAGRNERQRLRLALRAESLEQLALAARPVKVIANADKPAQHTRPFFDGKAGVRVNPPCNQVPHEAVRVRVTRCPHVAANTGHGTVAREHIPKLRPGELADFIEANERDLRPLPVQPVNLVFHARELAGREAPFQGLAQSRCAKLRVEL